MLVKMHSNAIYYYLYALKCMPKDMFDVVYSHNFYLPQNM